MNKYTLQIFFFSILIMFCTNIGNAQVGLNFQGVARKNDNSIISSQLISIKLSILQGTPEGILEYNEVRNVMTNKQGLFVVVIGDTGTIRTLGNFNNINWKQFPKFLKIEMDPSGGDNFITMGTTQFQYVAYAKYASGVDAENIIGTIPIKAGGTGATNLIDLKKALVLDNLNNTADIEKPISTLTKTALDLKLNLSDSIKYTKKLYTDSLLQTKLNLSDTSKMISNRIAKDTLNLSNRINFKEDLVNKSTDINLGGTNPSDTLYPSQKAVKSYVSSNTAGILTEVTRATNAENALNTRITSNTASITTEITRATNAENALDTRITSNTASISSNTYNIAANTLSITTLKSSLVPYTGATGAVNLGAYDLTVNGLVIGTGPLGVSSNNLIFGRLALNSNTSGTANTAIGAGTLMNNTVGYSNFAIGAGSLLNNIDGNSNLALGIQALNSNNSGFSNTGIGSSSLFTNTTGNWNVGLGTNSLYHNQTGSYNFAIGSSSLYKNVDGRFNVAIGNNALFENLHSSNNVAIGSDALLNALGENNTAVGISSLAQNGGSNHNGSRNTAIGRYTDINADDVQNSTVIGYGAVVGTSNTIQLGNSDITSVNTSGTFKSNGIISNLILTNSTYTAQPSDEIITGDASSSSFTITLPTAVGIKGQTYTIKRTNAGANTVTVGTTSSQTIDGSTTYLLSALYMYVKVVSDGTNWIIVGNN